MNSLRFYKIGGAGLLPSRRGMETHRQRAGTSGNGALLHHEVSSTMRYLVKARIKPGSQESLLQSITNGTLGKGSIAGDEYTWNMHQARVGDEGVVRWVETCFCAMPLAEERPYWEEYFELLSVKDAHNRKNCRHENGTELWACCNCDCTEPLEERLRHYGESFLKTLQESRQRISLKKSRRVLGPP